MSNQYRASNELGRARFGDEVFEAEFSVDEEADWLNRGALVLEPRPYRVLSDNYTIEGHPVPGGSGAVVTAGFPIDIEAALIAGGHLERVKPESPKKAPAKRAASTKE